MAADSKFTQIVDADGVLLDWDAVGGGDLSTMETRLQEIENNTDGLEANLTTIIGHVDGLEGLLADNATGADVAQAAADIVAAVGAISIDVGEVTVGIDYSVVDDAAWVPGGDLALIGGVADEGSPDALDEGDTGYARITLNRALHANLRTAAGAEIDLATGVSDIAAIKGGVDGIEALLGTIDADTSRLEAIETAVEATQAAVEGTLAVSAAALPLPSGAATAAHQVTQNGHMDGIEALLTTIDADTSGLAAIETAVEAVQAAVEGELTVGLPTGAATETTLAAVLADTATIDTNAAAAATSLAAIDDWDESDRAKVNIIAGQVGVQGGAGAVNALTQRVVLATDDPAVAHLANIVTAVQLIDDTIIADDAAFTVATTKVGMIGGFADEASPDSVTEGDGGAVRMSLERFLLINQRPTATGEGLSVARSIDLDESEEEIKSTPGKLYGYYLANLATAVRYVRFYDNTAAGTTVGSTTPLFTLAMEADQALHVAWDYGIPFATGLCWAATTGLADNDTGAPGANEIVGFALYK